MMLLRRAAPLSQRSVLTAKRGKLKPLASNTAWATVSAGPVGAPVIRGWRWEQPLGVLGSAFQAGDVRPTDAPRANCRYQLSTPLSCFPWI